MNSVETISISASTSKQNWSARKNYSIKWKIIEIISWLFKELRISCNAGETQEMQVWTLGKEDPPGGGNGNPSQYSDNPLQ